MRLLSSLKTPWRIVAMTLWLGIPSLTVEAQPLSSLPQRSELDLVIGDSIGTQPRFAVPDCLPLTSDSQTAEAAATIADVLWEDLAFEL